MTRLEEIAAREAKARAIPVTWSGTVVGHEPPNANDLAEFCASAPDDVRWLLTRIRAAEAYIARILDGDKNNQQLIEIKRILNGESDGQSS